MQYNFHQPSKALNVLKVVPIPLEKKKKMNTKQKKKGI